ncbi:MAG: amino acid adenylation domain-containing protein [Acaryochloris sp. CRU_2_0]|nr:amino acid adenylation domain-containing protein [Acaryochloris sp. CRU_2_0]
MEVLNPERTLAYSPLFQVIFNLDIPMALPQLAGMTLTPMPVATTVAEADLNIRLYDTAQGLVGHWEYRSDLFEAETIARMAAHFENLLTVMVADISQPVATLPLLSDAERHQLLVDWNDTTVNYAQNQCIHQLFETQVERSPNAIAVVFEGKQLTYQELNDRANQLAHYLQELGVGPEVLVGLCVERSIDMVVSLLGILKAGGAYVPLDPTYPPQRLQFILNDAQVPVLLTQEHLLDTLPEHEAQVMCLDRDWAIVAQTPEEKLPSRAVAENLAYVIYTSGSTGQPKGVQISHQAVLRLVSGARYTPLDSTVVCLQLAPIAFDAATFEIWGSLLHGGQCILYSVSGTPEPQELQSFLERHRVTTLWLTAALFNTLIMEAPETLASVKELLIGGEVLSVAHIREAQRWLPDTQLINGYGPTESTTFTCCYRIPRGLPEELSSIPIGRPISNTQVYILDTQLQPVPIGMAGELHIGGAGLARGYLNRPELTAEKFIANPFGEGRLYKTGDLARYLPDGTIEFLGRIDYQVKIRGFRVELGEIEAVLGRHEQVQHCVVVAREDIPGNKRLVAYVVGAGEPDITALKAYLKEHLPDYMVPSVVIPLRALPLTPNGKVDRRALPAPSEDLSRTSGFVSPQTEIEQTLAAIWQEILGLEQVGIHDNFFEVGGDSILSIQVIARAKQSGFTLSPKHLFQHQTIVELARVVSSEPASKIVAQQDRVTGSVPLTPIQQWFMDQSWLNPHHFNQAVLLQMPSTLQMAVLQQSLEELVAHHDALRLRFEPQEEEWHQYHVDDDGTVPSIEVIDLSHVPASEQASTLEAIASQRQASLHLSQGPVMRVVLFELGEHQSHRLLIVLHHLVVDGVSWRILLGDWFTLYQQHLAGEAPQLLPKTTAFQDWALQLQSYSRSVELQSQLEYWLSRPWSRVRTLPLDGEAPSSQPTSATKATVWVSLSADETEQLLKQVPQAYNTQINDVLLTALVQVIGRWSESTTVAIDLEGHGREALFETVDLSRTVGWFTSLYPVVLEVANPVSIGEVIKAIKEQLQAIPQMGMSYGLLRYMSGVAEVEAALANLPKVEVSFNYLGQIEQGLVVLKGTGR